MSVFNRNKHVGVRMLAPDRLEIRTAITDSFHQAAVAVEFSVPSGTIVNVKREMNRSINSKCLEILPRLEELKGWQVRPGLTPRVDGFIGGPQGCTKICNLALECCQLYPTAMRVYFSQSIDRSKLSDQEIIVMALQRNPHLRNSCGVFADNSPLVKGVTLREEAAAVAAAFEFKMPTSHLTPEGLDCQAQYLLLNRNKLLNVDQLDDKTIRVNGIFDDFAHTMIVTLDLHIPELKIIAVQGEIRRAPYNYCREGTIPHLEERLVGITIEPGLTQKIDKLITRSCCNHYGNLVLEACHAALEGTLGLYLNPNQAPNIDIDAALERWLSDYPMMRGTCLAYA